MSAGTLDRRQLLIAGAAAMSALAVPAPLRALAADLLRDQNLSGFGPELESVTATEATFWWPTDLPADTTLRIGPEGRPKQSFTVEKDQTVHVAKVKGLTPGATYEYELVSANKTQPTNIANPGRFTTLTPPKGERIARIAVLNDLHIGEHCAGTLTNLGDQSIPPCFSDDNYSVKMVSAAVREIRKARPDLVLANGDLSDRGRPDEIRTALAILKRAKRPVIVTRGNHDRLYDDCTTDRDCLKAQAFPGRFPQGHHALTTEQDVGDHLTVVGLDSCDPESGHGDLNHNGQIEFLEQALAKAKRRNRRVLLAFHHPVTPAAITTALPPISFGIEYQNGGQALEEAVKHQDHIALALHGHTHRNYLSYSKGCAAPFLEAGTVKEYPGSWTRLDIHTDGVMRTSHRVSEPYCRRWIRTTAGEYDGLAPTYLRGPLEARCFVHRYDSGQDVPATIDGPLGAPSLLG